MEFLVSLISGVIAGLLGNDLYDRGPRFAAWLLARAVAKLRDDQKERYREEWSAYRLTDCATKLDQVQMALSIWWGAGKIAREGLPARTMTKTNLNWIIAGAGLMCISQVAEAVIYTIHGAPLWYLFSYVPTILSSAFVACFSTWVRKKDGHIIEM